MAEKIGYYDGVTEEFLGEVDDAMRQCALDFFKGTLEKGDGVALIKIERHNPARVHLKGFKLCREYMDASAAAQG